MGGRQPKRKDSARELAIEAARLAEQSNCYDIVVMDLRKVSPVTDYFVICTGTSDRQMRTVAHEIVEHGDSLGQQVWHVDGTDSAEWILLDFVDVVVHLFDQPHRQYYDLELIWGAAPKVRWRRRASGPIRPSRRGG